MYKSERTKISKFLSLVLRHKPEEIGLYIDQNGWANIVDIISKTNEFELNIDKIIEVVATSEKRRFQLSEDQSKIRASQGHSISVNLELQEKKPPEILYHGTAEIFVTNIKEKGLNSQERNHVHLSTDIKTALSVGGRYGKPVILTVQALSMNKKGYKFYLSDNGVWLTDNVPVEFIIF